MMKENKIIFVVSLVFVVLGICIYLFLSNREYKYVCFNMDINEDTLVIEEYLEECISTEKLDEDVITDKDDLLTDDVFISYRLLKDYKKGEKLYKNDFALYEAPRAASSDIELLTELEVMNHGNSSEDFTKYKAYIKDKKLFAVNLNTNEEKMIFDKEEVLGIAVRPFCCAGEGYLLILTTNGNAYISEKDCNYAFGFDFPFIKLDGSDIVSLKLISENDIDFVKNLYGINSKGEEILLQKFN